MLQPTKLALWLDASQYFQRRGTSSSLSLTPPNDWIDRGPNQYHFKCADSGGTDYPTTLFYNQSRAKNGLQTITHGTNSAWFARRLLEQVSRFCDGDGTWFFVFQQRTSGSSTAQSLFYWNAGSETVNFEFNTSDSGNLIVSFGSSTAGAGGLTTSIPLGMRGAWAVWSVIKDGFFIRVYRNGVLMNEGANSLTRTPPASNRAIIGAKNLGLPSACYFGQIAEIKMYHGAMAPDQHAVEVENLIRKWGLRYQPWIGGAVGDAVIHYDAGHAGPWVHGDSVTLWPNLGTGGATMDLDTVTATGPVFEMIGDTPGLRFNANGYISTAGAVQPVTGSDYAAFAVVTLNSHVDNSETVYDWTSQTPSTQNFYLKRNGASTTEFSFGHYTGSGGTLNTRDPNTLYRGRLVLGYRKNGTAAYWRHNQQGSSATTHASGAMTTASRVFSVGGHAASNQRFNGWIHEIMICATAMSEADVDATCARLMKKWNC